MAGQNNSVGFFSPQAVVAPDLATEQMQIDRRRAIAQALQAQSLQSDGPSNGAVSWTQGLAKLGQALAARRLNAKADKQQSELYRAFGARLSPMFGVNAESTMPAKGGDPAQPQGDGAAATPAVTPSPTFSAAFSPQATAAIQAGASPAVEQPAAEQPAQSYQPGPMSLSGDPRADMARWSMDPQEYVKAVIAAHAPTDFAKQLQQSGVDPSSPIGRQLMQGQIAKQNYIAPINGRPGSTIRDPFDPSKVIGYDAPNIDGAFPVYGQNGMPAGYQQAPGAASAIGAAEGAKAGAKAAAEAPFDLVTVIDGNGNQYQVPKSTLTGGGGAPAGGKSLNGYYGQGSAPTGRSGLSPAEVEASKVSAGNFSQAINAGTGAQQANFQLDRIADITKNLQTGTWSGQFSDARSGWNANTPDWAPKFNTADIAKFDELKKITSNLAQTLSTGAGMNGTDARLQAAINALPNSNYSPQAIQNVVTMLKGFQSAALARGNAAAAWQQQHGANTFPEFQRQWQANYDPVLFEHYAQGPQAFAKWAQSLSADQRQSALTKYRTLKGMGAF